MKNRVLEDLRARQTVARQIAERESFRERVDALLVEMTVAARGFGAKDPHAVAVLALEELVRDLPP